MPCIIFSTLWKKTYTVCLRTWFELDQIICITVKYEVGILLIFSWCCFFFFFKACLPPMCVGSFGIPSPKKGKHRVTAPSWPQRARCGKQSQGPASGSRQSPSSYMSSCSAEHPVDVRVSGWSFLFDGNQQVGLK